MWRGRAAAIAVGVMVASALPPVASVDAAPAGTVVARTWTGACATVGCDPRAWGEPGNWTPGGVPEPGDSVVVGLPHVVGGLPESIGLGSLTVRAGATLAAEAGRAVAITADRLTLDCATVVGLAVRAATTLTPAGLVRGGSLTVPSGGVMTVRSPIAGDDGCAGRPDDASLVGRLVLSDGARLSVAGTLRGEAGSVTGADTQSRVVVTSNGTLGDGSGGLALDGVTTVIGGAVAGTGVLVTGGRDVTLRGREPTDLPRAERFRLLPGSLLTLRSSTASGTTTVSATGALLVRRGATLRIGAGVTLRGSSVVQGQGTVAITSTSDPARPPVTIMGFHQLSRTGRMVSVGRVRLLGETTTLTLMGPTTLGGRWRLVSGARLHLGGPTTVMAAMVDAGGRSRGVVRVLEEGVARLGTRAAPVIRDVPLVIAGRLLLGGRALALERTTVEVTRTGSLVGPGRVGGPTVVAGRVLLAARGLLAVAGRLRLAATATVRLVVGRGRAQSDRVGASGPVALGGRLVLAPRVNALPPLALVSGSRRAGAFTSVSGVPAGRRLVYASTAARLALADLLPDLTMLPAEDLLISAEKGKRLLRFTTIIANVGRGPFLLDGRRACGSASRCPEMRVRQRLLQWDGGSRTIATDARMKMEVGDGHDHWHVIGMERFELFDLDRPGGGRPLLGRKFGYCFFDVRAHRLSLPGAPSSKQHSSAGCGGAGDLANRMGLSVGWGDAYPWYLYGQWIDITGVGDGDYLLCLTADPRGHFTELREANNQSWRRLRLAAGSVGVLDTGTGACSRQLPGGRS